ncbi:MAG: TIGR00341 family protein [Brachymonas sp.]|nr:TIGR00341 family protein [Brachymonas sp.]
MQEENKTAEAASEKRQLPLSLRFRRIMRERFSLRDHKADDEEIEARIRDAVELRGATPWILVFAILVASVGLNVNSTAVIIGAMLISPLMGPIMGAGLGVAVYDFALLRRSLANLGIATAISLVVSALYFALTPLQQAQSELLARTSPTLWDVLIAWFGGLAGIVGVTRKEKSNVIPGVAIATALMPPVCTAGFGLATGQWRFVGGALYLYAINCVFISLATIVGLRVLRLRLRGFADLRTERKVKTILWALVLLMVVPSSYLAVDLVKQEVFKSRAQNFVHKEFVFAKTHVVDTQINPVKRSIALSLIGDPLDADALQNIEARLAGAGLENTQLVLKQAENNQLDVTELKSSLMSDLLQSSQEVIKRREAELKEVRAELAARNTLLRQADDIHQELQQLFPQVSKLILADGVTITAAGGKQQAVYVHITSPEALPADVRQRMGDWLKLRLKADRVAVVFDQGNDSTVAAASAAGAAQAARAASQSASAAASSATRAAASKKPSRR